MNNLNNLAWRVKESQWKAGVLERNVERLRARVSRISDTSERAKCEKLLSQEERALRAYGKVKARLEAEYDHAMKGQTK